ncbi:MAG TPA: hypothetical protein VEZ12_04805 [Herpetosiphonaceae bacterium]|nr:hypothetical protein [Herpetosiphonaceae bacterium]
MPYLLDTNTCVEHLRGRSAAITRKLATLQATEIQLCSVVRAELLYGALRSAENNRFFFHPGEFRALFPEDVVGWMEQKARTKDNAEKYAPLLPLPDPAELPVVVATRMSLSFPLLISAVPLYAIDSTRRAKEDEAPEQCWFSDGGITSNLHVHFFDAPLPQWPTFAMNLREFHPDYPRSDDECENSFLPTNNRSGMSAWMVLRRLSATVPIDSMAPRVVSLLIEVQASCNRGCARCNRARPIVTG